MNGKGKFLFGAGGKIIHIPSHNIAGMQLNLLDARRGVSLGRVFKGKLPLAGGKALEETISNHKSREVRTVFTGGRGDLEASKSNRSVGGGGQRAYMKTGGDIQDSASGGERSKARRTYVRGSPCEEKSHGERFKIIEELKRAMLKRPNTS